MEKLLSSLKNIPEYQVLLKALSDKESAAVTGIGQINRSHLIACLRSETAVPMVVIVQDDIAAKRLQQELKDFLGQDFPVLPQRELTFYDAAVVALPQISANHTEASLIHEAAIGKIAGEQLIKLMTLGLSEKEAEEQIINGFLK